MSTSNARDDSAAKLQDAVFALHRGGVIAYPTEAVFGLGCNPRDEQALQRIIDIKGRDEHKGFILVASDQSQLQPYIAPIDLEHQARLDRYWPGPVTFVVPASAQFCNTLLSGYRKTLAVRVSNHPLVTELCQRYGSAIVSTSANCSGEPALRTADAVHNVLGEHLDGIVTGHTGGLTAPTSIFELVSGKQIR